MLDARYSHLYFCHSLNRLQRGLSAIAELFVLYEYENQSRGRPPLNLPTGGGLLG